MEAWFEISGPAWLKQSTTFLSVLRPFVWDLKLYYSMILYTYMRITDRRADVIVNFQFSVPKRSADYIFILKESPARGRQVAGTAGK